MREHTHISLFGLFGSVQSLFGSVQCTCTAREAEALAVVTGYRAANVSERKPFLSPDLRRHRAGFTNIGELWDGSTTA